jgi:hypothetical protein
MIFLFSVTVGRSSCIKITTLQINQQKNNLFPWLDGWLDTDGMPVTLSWLDGCLDGWLARDAEGMTLSWFARDGWLDRDGISLGWLDGWLIYSVYYTYMDVGPPGCDWWPWRI